MSRFIRRSGESGSGIDLSTCALNTNQPITTSSSFCGSGRTLCDTSWDLVCCFYNNACIGCFGTSLRIDLPTHCYNQFDFTICGICLTCSGASIYFSNSACACTCCTAGFLGCPLCFGYLVPIISFYCAVNCTQGIPALGNGSPCCFSSLGFNLKLTRKSPDNGIDICYCSNPFNSNCFLCQEYRASINGCGCANLAWNPRCDCACRFTTVIICAGCGMSYDQQFNFNIYGRKNNSTCYTTWG